MASSDTMVTRLPQWAQMLGITTPVAAIAVYLVWWITSGLTFDLHKQADLISRHLDQTDSLIATTNSMVSTQGQILENQKEKNQTDTLRNEERLKEFHKLTAFERQTCINTAKSTYQTQRCMEIEPDQ